MVFLQKPWAQLKTIHCTDAGDNPRHGSHHGSAISSAIGSVISVFYSRDKNKNNKQLVRENDEGIEQCNDNDIDIDNNSSKNPSTHTSISVSTSTSSTNTSTIPLLPVISTRTTNAKSIRMKSKTDHNVHRTCRMDGTIVRSTKQQHHDLHHQHQEKQQYRDDTNTTTPTRGQNCRDTYNNAVGRHRGFGTAKANTHSDTDNHGREHSSYENFPTKNIQSSKKDYEEQLLMSSTPNINSLRHDPVVRLDDDNDNASSVSSCSDYSSTSNVLLAASPSSKTSSSIYNTTKSDYYCWDLDVISLDFGFRVNNSPSAQLSLSSPPNSKTTKNSNKNKSNNKTTFVAVRKNKTTKVNSRLKKRMLETDFNVRRQSSTVRSATPQDVTESRDNENNNDDVEDDHENDDDDDNTEKIEIQIVTSESASAASFIASLSASGTASIRTASTKGKIPNGCKSRDTSCKRCRNDNDNDNDFDIDIDSHNKSNNTNRSCNQNKNSCDETQDDSSTSSSTSYSSSYSSLYSTSTTSTASTKKSTPSRFSRTGITNTIITTSNTYRNSNRRLKLLNRFATGGETKLDNDIISNSNNSRRDGKYNLAASNSIVAAATSILKRSSRTLSTITPSNDGLLPLPSTMGTHSTIYHEEDEQEDERLLKPVGSVILSPRSSAYNYYDYYSKANGDVVDDDDDDDVDYNNDDGDDDGYNDSKSYNDGSAVDNERLRERKHQQVPTSNDEIFSVHEIQTDMATSKAPYSQSTLVVVVD